ncbi:uncharacterized protein LOC143232559 [Tachypleus tridentatus]|uniref:uncharacterized protein LOC143232559 n=1 Tax=Tachypleus tridentatus TaxID=6853 RepID=UPI003FD52861
MYKYPRLRSVDSVRELMLNKMVGEGETLTSQSKVDLSKLPPCHRSLLPHIKRVNYRVAQWKRFDVRMLKLPPPTDHGWVLNDGILDPVWSEGPVLPGSLVDILDVNMAYDESEDESDEDGPDIESFSSDDDLDNEV